jgi:hypothetical protein
MCSHLSLINILFKCHYNCNNYIRSTDRALSEQDRNYAIRTSEHTVPKGVLVAPITVSSTVDTSVNHYQFKALSFVSCGYFRNRMGVCVYWIHLAQERDQW